MEGLFLYYFLIDGIILDFKLIIVLLKLYFSSYQLDSSDTIEEDFNITLSGSREESEVEGFFVISHIRMIGYLGGVRVKECPVRLGNWPRRVRDPHRGKK